jgi:hypothetical protein
MSNTKAVKAKKPVKRKTESHTQKAVVAALTDKQMAADPRAHARSTLSSSVGAANTVHAWRRTWKDGQTEDPQQRALDVQGLAEELFDQCRAIQSGNMKRPEAMLSSQAHTLDAIFNTLATRAASNVGHQPETAELYLRLALRAQSQCRAALETLSLLKNPPSIAFVRQANVSNGPQQVNNGVPPREASLAHAGHTDNLPNKLLEQQPSERMDARTAPATVGSDTTMEAVAEIHRPADGEG